MRARADHLPCGAHVLALRWRGSTLFAGLGHARSFVPPLPPFTSTAGGPETFHSNFKDLACSVATRTGRVQQRVHIRDSALPSGL